MLLFLVFSLAKLWRAQFAIYCCIVIASLPGEFLTLFSAGQNSQSVRNRWALWVCREVPYRIRPKIQRHLRKVTCKCFMLFCTSQSMSNNGRKAGATILFLSVIMHRKVEQISQCQFFCCFLLPRFVWSPSQPFFCVITQHSSLPLLPMNGHTTGFHPCQSNTTTSPLCSDALPSVVAHAQKLLYLHELQG